MKLSIFFMLLLSGFCVKAQQIPPPPPPLADSASQYSKDTVGIFTKVEIEAGYPGGISSWKKYLETNFRIDSVADLVWKGMTNKQKRKTAVYQQTAIVQFIVCKDGSVCEIKTINNVHPAIQAEAERLIAESNKWEPATVDGRKVKAYRRQPITFALSVE